STALVATSTYSYDNLDRLTAALMAGTSTYTNTFAYDVLGSLTSKGTGGTASTTIPSASAYWKFDEANSTAADSTGNGNTLTNNNTVTYSGGKINNGANLVAASSQYFSITNASSTN